MSSAHSGPDEVSADQSSSRSQKTPFCQSEHLSLFMRCSALSGNRDLLSQLLTAVQPHKEMNSEEESTGQRTKPLRNKNESTVEAGNTKGFSFTSQRHPDPLFPRCSPGRAAKEGGQRGSRSRTMQVARSLHSGGCQGLLPRPPWGARLRQVPPL